MNVPDNHVVRPVAIMRMSHSAALESMEWPAEHMPAFESSQPDAMM
jgi:hypothetical protein